CMHAQTIHESAGQEHRKRHPNPAGTEQPPSVDDWVTDNVLKKCCHQRHDREVLDAANEHKNKANYKVAVAKNFERDEWPRGRQNMRKEEVKCGGRDQRLQNNLL